MATAVKEKGFFGRVIDSLSVNGFGRDNLMKNLRGLTSSARTNLLGDFFQKGGDLSKLIDKDTNENIAFGRDMKNMSVRELELYEKQGLLNIRNNKGESLLTDYSNQVLKKLEKGTISEHDVNLLLYLSKQKGELEKETGVKILEMRDKISSSNADISIKNKVGTLFESVSINSERTKQAYYERNKGNSVALNNECKTLYASLNDGRINKDAIKNINTMLDNGAKLNEQFAKNLTKLKGHFPEIKEFEDLAQKVKEKNPQFFPVEEQKEVSNKKEDYMKSLLNKFEEHTKEKVESTEKEKEVETNNDVQKTTSGRNNRDR